ncbi:MAG: spermidine synthase [Planctomycetota bacterium]|jgi:spermidine synthase
MFLLCGGGLIFELAFNKIVGVQGYGRLGDIAIGTALFGYALAGVLYITVDRIRSIPVMTLVPRACLGTGAAMVLAHLVTTWVPLDFAKAFAAPAQTLIAAAVWYIVLALPFFTASLAIVALLTEASSNGKRVGRLYGADLLGAGVGAVFAIQGIALMGGAGTLWFAGALCCVAGLLFAADSPKRTKMTMGIGAIVIGVGVFTVAPAIGIKVHALKRGYLEDLEAGRIIGTHWSAISRIDIAKRERAHMIWFDGGSMQSRMLAKTADLTPGELSAFDYSSTTLPYRIKPREHALVIASSGGSQVRSAVHFGTKKITAVEVDTAVVKHVQTTYDEWLDGLFNRPEVNLVNAEGRSFLRHSNELYDVIQIESAYSNDMLVTGAAGNYNSYLLTNEAISDYWEHLTDDGILFLAQAHGPRLFAQMLSALDELGVDPKGRIYFEEGHLSLGGNVMLVRKTPFPKEELETIAAHAKAGEVPIFYAPDALWKMVGKNWKGKRPDKPLIDVCKRIATLEGEERLTYLKSLPYEAVPTTDDKPFYNRYFPFFSKLPDPKNVKLPREIAYMASSGRKLGPVPISDVPPVVILLEAALLLLPIIILPWRKFRKEGLLGTGKAGGKASKGLLLEWIYFSAIGLGFIAIEVVLARRFVLFFGSPTVALAVVLGGLLTFAGLGSSLLSPFFVGKKYGPVAIIVALVALVIGYAYGLDSIFATFKGADSFTRYAFGLLTLLPLGLLMGVPFPAGLGQVTKGGEGRVAWAWAINGYSSVVATASIGIGIQMFGYRQLFFIGAALYLVAAVCYAALVSRMDD